MGILSLFGRSPGTVAPMPPASPWSDGALTEIILAKIFGTDIDVPPITRKTAMSLATVARVRHRLFSSVSRLPLVASRGIEVMSPQPSIVRQPEPNRARALTFGWIADQLLFYGRAWLVGTDYAADTDGGRIRSAKFVPEDQGRYDTNGNLVGLQGEEQDLDQATVYRIDGPHEGLLVFAASTLERAWRLERAADRASDNPVPSIDLHQTGGQAYSDGEVDAMIARWAAARRRATGGIAYTNPNVEAKVLGAPVEQLLIDGRRQAALDLVRACGAPAWLADVPVDGSDITYANVAARNRDVIDDFVSPYLEAIAGRFSLDDILPHGTWARFDTNELLRADFSERMTSYKTATESGVYDVDDLIEIERGRALE